MSKKSETGVLGEKKACEFLAQHHYTILHTNWYYRHKELDIIARKDDKLIIVEVKTRTNRYFEDPKEAVTIKKQRMLVAAADAFVQQYDIDMEVRFDVVSVLFENGKTEIEHIENAFYPLL